MVISERCNLKSVYLWYLLEVKPEVILILLGLAVGTCLWWLFFSVGSPGICVQVMVVGWHLCVCVDI